MHPYRVSILGIQMSIWNATFLLGLAVGYLVLLSTFLLRPTTRTPRLLVVRWLFTAYISALGAQLFAYLFDDPTTFLPPPSVSWVRYYLDPLFGPKTLYGAIVFLPVGVLAVSAPWRDLDYNEALDRWTPALMAVLGVSRVGCLLQGCCHGIPSAFLGVTFLPGSPAFARRVQLGLERTAEATPPLLAVQLISALALFLLCGWALRQLAAGRAGLFLPSVAAYSLFQFWIEFVRDDPSRNFLGPLSTSQWIAIVILGMYAAWHSRRPQTTTGGGSSFHPRSAATDGVSSTS